MKIPCLYPNQTAVLFATGPSLSLDVVNNVRPYHENGKVRAFGCNDTYKIVDFLDVHYACDKEWWEYNGNEALKTLSPACHVWTQSKESADKFSINHIPGSHDGGLYIKDRSKIHFGANSGFQLVNVAYHYGIRKFILVGYNMGIKGNMTHFFGNHPGRLQKSSPFPRFIEAFRGIQPEIRDMIVNCTPNTSLTVFRVNNLIKELEDL